MSKLKSVSDIVGPEVIADLLSVSRNTVLNWAKSGQIPSIRVGKVYRFSLRAVSQSINFKLVKVA